MHPSFPIRIAMRSCPTALKPLFRHLAAVTLVVFVVAQVLCFIHCHSGGGHGSDAEKPSCHGTAAQSHHDEDGSSSPKPLPTGSCSTLKNLFASNGTLTLVVPDSPSLYVLNPFALALDTTAIEPSASISRHAGPREWSLTPEVYLGPAIHSLAPPLLS